MSAMGAPVPTAVRPTVLLAEDDGALRRLLALGLARAGFNVEEAGSGLELHDALRGARERGILPAAILSDIRMPGLTGLRATKIVRSWGWDAPVVLFTAFADDETLDAAARAGASVVVSKPFEVDDLAEMVAWLLEHPERGSSSLAYVQSGSAVS